MSSASSLDSSIFPSSRFSSPDPAARVLLPAPWRFPVLPLPSLPPSPSGSGSTSQCRAPRGPCSNSRESNKQIRLGLVRDVRPLFQWNKRLSSEPRVDHIRSPASRLLDDFPEPQRHIQAQVFLHQPGRANRSRIVPAVTAVDHDPSNLQAQRARQRGLPIARGLWRARRPN